MGSRVAVLSGKLDNLSGDILVLLVVGAIALASYYYTGARVNDLTEQTHTTLCAFKGDLQRRYEGGRDFLAENPNGIPGISRASIERSLMAQRSTLDALANLDCR